jgi:hypothetical protein
VQSCELFFEFFFELLHEKAEPLVLVLESIKALSKFNEYAKLVHKEKLSTYIGLESYKELKEI